MYFINSTTYKDMDRRTESDVDILDISGSPTSTSPGSTQVEMSKYPDYCQTMIVKDANGQVKELVFPKALDLDRPKRARTTFSQEQLYKLEDEFQRNQYLVGRERTELSRRLQLSETQIKVWFQNRRTKYKRDKQKDQDPRSTTICGDNFSSGKITKLFSDNVSPPIITTTATTTKNPSTLGPLLPPSTMIPHILPYPPPAPLGTTAVTHLPPYPHPLHTPPLPPTSAHFPFHLAAVRTQHAGLYGTHRNYLSQS